MSQTPMTDTERLAAFETVYDEFAASLVTVPVELERLRTEGREKSVRYRELFGQKLFNAQVKDMFERHGITFDA